MSASFLTSPVRSVFGIITALLLVPGLPGACQPWRLRKPMSSYRLLNPRTVVRSGAEPVK